MLNSLLIWALGGLFFSAEDTLSNPEIPVYSHLVENQVVTIQEDFSFLHQVTKNLTIYTSEGMEHARVALGYDKLREIVSFEMEVFNPLTKKTIQKARLKDMSDIAQYSQTNIFDDNRIKYFEPTSYSFPVNIQIKYETRTKTNFVLPTWVVVPSYNQQVEVSTFEVSYPENLGIKFKELNLSGSKSEGLELGRKTITWTENSPPVQGKDFEKEDDHRLLLAPVNFGLSGYHGKMEDWSGLAAWQYELNKGRNTLPDDFQAKIRAMTANKETDYEKVSVLYDYLQKNFRYVSIQLGIGGWQTMEAKEVVNSGFGDCKGLTNLMKSMLEIVGIPSNYTLVYAGSDADDIETDLPSNQFNHVILQVPTGNEPIWLECTSSTLPPGYLGDFTSDRHVLVVKENGGYLTKTPAYKEESWNKSSSKTILFIENEGNARISSVVNSVGNLAVELQDVKSHLDERQQRDYLNRNAVVTGLLVKDFSITTDRQDSLLLAQLKYEGFVQKFIQNTAKRIILKPFLGKIHEDHLENGTYLSSDEFEIQLPDAWQLDGAAPNLNLEDEFFSGSLSTSLDGMILRVKRNISINVPDELESDQKEKLIKQINSAFDKTLIFHRPTTN